MDVLYDKIDQLSYPTRIELYYNGDITSTLSTTRFISYDDQNYLIGISPNGKSPLFLLLLFSLNHSQHIEYQILYQHFFVIHQWLLCLHDKLLPSPLKRDYIQIPI